MQRFFAQLILGSILFLIACNNGKKPPLMKTNKDWYNVAFLITDGVYNTELAAPFDIFQHTQYRHGLKAMNVFTVSNTSDLVRTFEGLYIKPDFNFLIDTLPRIDILVVPSAVHHLDTDLENKDLLSFIARIDHDAMFMTSHCDGAFMLAKAGILDKSISTTFPTDVKKYKAMFPHLNVMDSVLFVHDGKYITSAGGVKSYDAALYLINVMYSDSIAKSIAKGLVIDWDTSKIIYYKKP